MDFRIGFGYDVHRLAQGETLMLGGIVIPHTKGSVGHSDGDTLVHAICDALLGAANMRDIGYHFPDTDSDYRGIDSKILLKQTIKLIAEKHYRIGNIDSTISLQKPKIKEYIPTMQMILAETCGIEPDSIAIKATTTEKLGFEGREEGVSASAVALIYKQQ